MIKIIKTNDKKLEIIGEKIQPFLSSGKSTLFSYENTKKSLNPGEYDTRELYILEINENKFGILVFPSPAKLTISEVDLIKEIKNYEGMLLIAVSEHNPTYFLSQDFIKTLEKITFINVWKIKNRKDNRLFFGYNIPITTSNMTRQIYDPKEWNSKFNLKFDYTDKDEAIDKILKKILIIYPEFITFCFNSIQGNYIKFLRKKASGQIVININIDSEIISWIILIKPSDGVLSENYSRILIEIEKKAIRVSRKYNLNNFHNPLISDIKLYLRWKN